MKKTITTIILAVLALIGGGSAAYFGTADRDRVTVYQVAGTSASAPLNIGSSTPTTTAYIVATDNYTQLDLNSVSNVSTTETISIKTDFSIEDVCGNSPASANWFTVTTTNITADGNLNTTIKENLIAKCLKFTIYNSSSTVTSTLYLQATLR